MSVLEYRFGACRLVPSQCALYAGDEPVKIGSRALDVLRVLVERRDRVVTKHELLDLVWPRLVVEENNLQVQVVTLRKLLGHPAIATIPGRGYRFTLPVVVEGDAPRDEPVAAPAPAPRASEGECPFLIGREAELEGLDALLAQRALVTIAGPGGIGKTRLAESVARRRKVEAVRAVHWVSLATLAEPALLAGAVAGALGISVDGAVDPMGAVLRVLAERDALLVLDNAEHLLDAVATFADAVRREAPRVQLLVTSQEVLRVADEQVYRVDPLTLPAGDELADALASGAVRLFVARATAADGRFRLTPDNARAVVDICRRLDGIPLAIELAAARWPVLGLDGVRTRLDERFRLLTGGSRAALRRHQTLRATLEWSHGLLNEAERAVFRRLGSFVGGFTLRTAQHLAQDDTIDPWDVLEHLGSLVDKSLVLTDDAEPPRYRMLETTRLYALERLAEAGETTMFLRRHAEAVVARLSDSGSAQGRWHATVQRFESDAAEIDNARAALAWATGADDAQLAIEVAAHCGLAFIRADRVNEFLTAALRLKPFAAEPLPPPVVGLFWLRIAFSGNKAAGPETMDAARHAIAIFRRLGDDEHLYEALACAVVIGAIRADAGDLQPLIDEAQAMERPDWPPMMRSYARWAMHRWLRRAGREHEALARGHEVAALTRECNPVLAARLRGIVVTDTQIALGQLDEAEASARTALDQLTAGGARDARVGPIHEGLALALFLQGRAQEAWQAARAALALLAPEGDTLRLLDTAALGLVAEAHWAKAARVLGHVDAALAGSGVVRWPAAERRREQLHGPLCAALGAEALQRERDAGAALAREQVVATAFDRAC